MGPPGSLLTTPLRNYCSLKALACMGIFERVMQTYGMMVNLTAEEEQASRARLIDFLAGRTEDDSQLAIEGIRVLRGDKLLRAGRVRS